MKVYVPPIKIQRIKTKLVPVIKSNIKLNEDTIWNGYNKIDVEHFYHICAKEENRNYIVEALLTNYIISENELHTT